MNYNKDSFTWGYEIEWGDIDRTKEIPAHLGSWEHAETDIVNLYEPYKYIACDPLGLEPPVGGEINTKPTKNWQEQVARIMNIKALFDKPSASCVNHGHLHVFVPGLKNDIDALKRLVKYIKDNQADTIEACYQFYNGASMNKAKGATNYLKFDGGRPMPDYMCDNIINTAVDFDHFIKLHAAGKDGISIGRPFRFAINLYCMKHTGTIEFRCFRSSINEDEIWSQFEFVEKFIDAALNDGPSVKEILRDNKFKFPIFRWDINEYMGWVNTKYDKSRGEKKREYHDVA